jgi:prophage antirepressor-like protein
MKFNEFRLFVYQEFGDRQFSPTEAIQKTGASKASVYRWLKMMSDGSEVINTHGVYHFPQVVGQTELFEADPSAIADTSQPITEIPIVEVVEEVHAPENPINPQALASFAYKQMGEVRTATVNGEPWFCLNDVCEVLLLTNSRKVASRLDPEEKGYVTLSDAMGRNRETTFINESGLYAVILRSDKPEAKPFRKWVTSEVLPAIRKTGRYEPEPQKPLSQLEMLAAMAQEAVKNEKRLDVVEAEINALKERRLKAEKELNLLPSASVPAVPKSTRAMINERVAAYSAATMISHAEIHRKLHKEFFYRHHVNLHSRFMANRDKYKSKLDIVEELGKLDDYLAIACEVLEVA